MNNNKINVRWLIKMAWRDSRRHRSRLLLFISSIVLGIAALVAIYSLGENVKKDIDAQAANLVGADLEIASNKPISDTIKQLIDSTDVFFSVLLQNRYIKAASVKSCRKSD